MFPDETRILTVDDTKMVLLMLKRYLNELGLKNVDEAKDGQEAWSMIEAAHGEGRPYGLVLSDWNMPNMKGIDLLKMVRADERFKGMPFIMVTSEGAKKSVIESAQAGTTDYIVKPVLKDQLQRKLSLVYSQSLKGAEGEVKQETQATNE